MESAGVHVSPRLETVLACPIVVFGVVMLTAATDRRAPIEALERQAPALAGAFTSHIHKSATGESMPYRLFAPRGLVRAKKYPLIVFLHGAGGSGSDNVRQLQGANVFGALVWTLPRNQQRHPAFVLAPQSNGNWACVIPDPAHPARTPADLKFCPPGVAGPGARLALDIIDDLVVALPIDRRRIYVTGHSMGGTGAWHLIAERPHLFAAAVPVCGHPNPATAAVVKDIPIWNFHGAADEIEPVETSRRMIGALRAIGARPRYSEYDGIGHDVFMWAYTEPSLVEWLFAQAISYEGR